MNKTLTHALLLSGLLTSIPALAEDAKVMDLVGPVSEYKLYVSSEVKELARTTAAFTAAIKAGNLAKAQALYAPTRMHYERIEPVAELFSDLDGAIDSRVDDHNNDVNAADFTGFHRLEHALFEQKTTKGQGAIVKKLNADVAELQKRLRTLAIPPEKMVGGAAALIEEVAATKISGEEDRYSHTDLWDFKANVEGSTRIVDLLRPQLAKADKPLLDKIDANHAAVNQILDKYRTKAGGFETYDKLTEADRNALKGPVTALAEDLSKLRGTLGLN